MSWARRALEDVAPEDVMLAGRFPGRWVKMIARGPSTLYEDGDFTPPVKWHRSWGEYKSPDLVFWFTESKRKALR